MTRCDNCEYDDNVDDSMPVGNYGNKILCYNCINIIENKRRETEWRTEY